jgi:rSAM/selenodomain-associated transferase 1
MSTFERDFEGAISIIPIHPFERASTVDHFGIFAKHWSPGKVKTRLGASIGLDQSARVYYAMLSDLISRLGVVGDQRTIAYTPHNAGDAFAQLTQSIGASWNLDVQTDGPLGDRMTIFFQTAFAAPGTQNVLLIGSDCPTITPAICQQAWDALASNDVVLGPTFDGGYYLVGMSHKFSDVFSGITYSTESVLDATIALMNQRDIKFELLCPLQDIDELPQLEELFRSINGDAENGTTCDQQPDSNLQPNYQPQLLSAIQTALRGESSVSPVARRKNNSDNPTKGPS